MRKYNDTKLFALEVDKLNYWKKSEVLWDYCLKMNTPKFEWFEPNNRIENFNTLNKNKRMFSFKYYVDNIEKEFKYELIDIGEVWKEQGFAQRFQAKTGNLFHYLWLNQEKYYHLFEN